MKIRRRHQFRLHHTTQVCLGRPHELTLWRAYANWRFHKVAICIVAVSAIITVSLVAHSMIFAVTSTATMVPDGDVSTVYTPWFTSDGGASHYSLVDDGTVADTSDYVHSSGNNLTDEYSFTSPSSIQSASQLVLHVDCISFTNAAGGTIDTINIDLLINGVVQPGGLQYTPVYNSWGDCTVTFSGNWTQSDVDNMDVQIYSTAQGGGNPSSRGDDVAVANIYGVLTYVPNLQLGQSAYRWFANQDTPAGQTTFAKTWGGPADECSYKCAITPTSDGGFVTTGETNSYGAGGIDFFLAKYDSAGGLDWDTIAGGASSDYSQYVIQTSDGGYAVTGLSDSYPASAGYDMFLSKFDSSGNLSWTKTWGGTGDDYGQSLMQTSDGSYVVAAITNGFGAGGWDMVLVKYDSNGNLLWDKTWGGSGTDESMDITEDANGDYVVAGWTDGYGAGLYDVVLLKYDPSGNLIWQKTWGGANYDVGESVVATSDGGFAVTGYTSLGAGGFDLFLAKYDSNGALTWDRTLGGAGTDDGRQVVQAADGGYVITGYTSSYGAGGNDLLLAKYDSSGNLVWMRTVGGSSDEDSRGLARTADDGYVAAAYTKSFGVGGNDILIAKFNSSGDISGCTSPLCQIPTLTNNSPAASTGTPAAGISSPSAATGSASFSLNTPTVPLSVVVPTAPSIDVGSPLAAQDASTTAPSEGTIFRLRLDIHVSGGQASGGGTSLKLQYADKGAAASCSAVSNANYQDVTDTSNGIRWANNPNAGNTQGIIANAADPQHGTDANINQNYQEKGTTSFTNTSAILAGQDGMWDFGLVAHHAIQNTTYCFKVVESTGSDLTTYTVYPQIVIPSATVTQASYRLFDNSDTAVDPVTYMKATGGSGLDLFKSIQLTSDGGFVAAGYTGSYGSGSDDAYVAKYDQSGNLSWDHTVGSTGADYFQDIDLTDDGGFVAAGYTNSFGIGTVTAYLVKLDPSGNPSWSRAVGGSGDNRFYSVQQVTDGGYVAVGYTNSYGAGGYDAYLVKYDQSGNFAWSRTAGGAGSDYFYDIKATTDGGFVAAGYTNSYGAGGDDAFIAKYNQDGSLDWSRTTGGAGDERFNGVTPTSDGYIAAGHTDSFSTYADAYLVKYDQDGNLVWSRITGGSAAGDNFQSVETTDDGGYIAVGNTSSYGAGGYEAYIVKYDSGGALDWVGTAGGSSDDYFHAVQQTADGGYMTVGETVSYGSGSSDGFLAKYDADGNIASCGAICSSPTPSNNSPASINGSPTPSVNTPASSNSQETSTATSPTVNSTVIVADGGGPTGVDVGTALGDQDEAVDIAVSPAPRPFRLRLSLGLAVSGVSANSLGLKLQYARMSGASCSSTPAGDYADVTDVSAIRFYDNAAISTPFGLIPNANDPSYDSGAISYQTYNEANPFTNDESAIYAGQYGLWDFPLIMSSGASHASYCMRVIYTNGIALSAYEVFPRVNMAPNMNQLMRGGEWFDRSGVKQNISL